MPDLFEIDVSLIGEEWLQLPDYFLGSSILISQVGYALEDGLARETFLLKAVIDQVLEIEVPESYCRLIGLVFVGPLLPLSEGLDLYLADCFRLLFQSTYRSSLTS